jgi:adenosylmethionine-8-amino-7-oxononanoate aminotransferase
MELQYMMLTAYRVFVHGHTYQGHPVACAAALEVQRIIHEENLLQNVQCMGKLMSEMLFSRIGNHPNVGDIRGRGLFWGVEFVADKGTAEPFPADKHVAMTISEMGLEEKYSVAVYPGSGTVDGTRGDHIIISPPYNVTAAEIASLVEAVGLLIEDYFSPTDRGRYEGGPKLRA